MRTGAFLMNSSSNWFESNFLVFQNGKNSLQCDLTRSWVIVERRHDF